MFLIVLIVTLTALKFFEFSFMESVSWWWISGLFFLTLIWFEVFERLLGFDKKQAHDNFNAIRKERFKRLFQRKK